MTEAAGASLTSEDQVTADDALAACGVWSGKVTCYGDIINPGKTDRGKATVELIPN